MLVEGLSTIAKKAPPRSDIQQYKHGIAIPRIQGNVANLSGLRRITYHMYSTGTWYGPVPLGYCTSTYAGRRVERFQRFSSSTRLRVRQQSPKRHHRVPIYSSTSMVSPSLGPRAMSPIFGGLDVIHRLCIGPSRASSTAVVATTQQQQQDSTQCHTFTRNTSAG